MAIEYKGEAILSHPDDCPESVIVMYWCSLDSAPHIGYRNKEALRKLCPEKAWVAFGSVSGWPHEYVVGWSYLPRPVNPITPSHPQQ